MEFHLDVSRFRQWAQARASLLSAAAFFIALARRYPVFTPVAAYALAIALTAKITPARTFTHTPAFDTTKTRLDPIIFRAEPTMPEIIYVDGNETVSQEEFFKRNAAPIKRDTAPQPPKPLEPLTYDDGHIRPFSEALHTLRMAAVSKEADTAGSNLGKAVHRKRTKAATNA